MNVLVEAYMYVQDQGAGITVTTFFKLLQKPGEL